MRKRCVTGVAVLSVAVATVVPSALAEPLRLRGHGVAPQAKPQRRAGGESFPPLPLPVTPLRRTEKKRQPAPPALIAKVAYGPVNWSVRDGKRVGRRDWLSVTDDVRNLLRWTGRQLGFRYRSFQTNFDKLSYDPAEIPVLYLTGHEPLPELSDEAAGRLRQFLYDGGTILANACCGAPEFTASFRRQMGRLFPHRRLGPLPADHPIFSNFYRIDRVRYHKGTGENSDGPPYLEALNIGCRAAVLFAPYDLANGWFGQDPPDNYQAGRWIVGDDARRLGGNIITYVLACYPYGRMRALQPVLYQQGEPTRDELVVGQIVHDGDWDPTPGGLAGLLRALRENSTLHTQFKRAELQLTDRDIFSYPVLYLTGLREFRLRDGEVEQLRTYLTSGGVLVAEAACGMASFDASLRRELARVLPDMPLTALEPDHPLYSAALDVTRVAYTPLVQQEQPGVDRPMLEGIEIDGALRVVYSRYGLSCGWERLEYPYDRGYAERDALRLGVNIFVYAMTH